VTTTMSEAKRLPIGDRIKWARKRKGFSHDTLASMTGTSRRHLIRLEKGENTPGIELRARIAAATEQSVDFFMDGDEDEEEDELARELVAVLRRLLAREGVGA
jgi:transcriptional regulator with XRE-family HTH domain